MRNESRSILLVMVAAACQAPPDSSTEPADIAAALAALPDASVLDRTPDGVPTFVRGRLAVLGWQPSLDAELAERQLRPALEPILAPFRLQPSDLALRRVVEGARGYRHVRYDQRWHGREVIGGELIVHVDGDGVIAAVSGTARGDVPADLDPGAPTEDEVVARIASDPRFERRAVSRVREVVVQTSPGRFHAATEALAEGELDGLPAIDLVYVDHVDGAIVAVRPQVHTGRNRRVHLFQGLNVDGQLLRSEGQGPHTDVIVNAVYDRTGFVYDAYRQFWNMDSYNNNGAAIVSKVHVPLGCNAFFSVQNKTLNFGDGSGPACLPVGQATDIVAHEYQHAVTDTYSRLVYEDESGAINESLSDIFGAFVEAWHAGGGALRVTAKTFLIGEEVIPSVLRRMCDPVSKGDADLWTPTIGDLDVHLSSGVGNLAFCLLVKGGAHPRGKTSVVVPGIGLDKVIRIAHYAQTAILSPNATYFQLWAAMYWAAEILYPDPRPRRAVTCAFSAVGLTIPGSFTCNTSDIVWQHTSGNVSVWGMRGGDNMWSTFPGDPGAAWRIVGTGDFNADGFSDLLWRHVDAGTAIWFMKDGNRIGDLHLPAEAGAGWSIIGVGDFNGGGTADILWRNVDGTVAVWLMHDAQPVAAVTLGQATAEWQLAGLGDFERDGMTDILWQRTTDGRASLWRMKDGLLTSIQELPSPRGVADVILRIADFDRDGRDDVLARHSVTGELTIWHMAGATIISNSSVGTPPAGWVVEAASDFDGNAKPDLLLRHTPTGELQIWLLDDATIVGTTTPGLVTTDWSVRGTGQLD